MTKEEIIEDIKEEIVAYTKGYLDALCHTYEIKWELRDEIEEDLKKEEVGND